MQTIWKFKLYPDGRATEMPKGAMVLSVGEQFGEICLWAGVDTDAEMEKRIFVTKGTGHVMGVYPGGLKFIGTIKLEGGRLIFHVFEAANAQVMLN